MRILICLWLLAGAMTPSAFAWPAGNTSLESWAGCYELRVAAADQKKELWGGLPWRIQLLAKPSGEPLEGVQWFETKTLNPAFEVDPHSWFPPMWKPDSEDVASIDIGNLFVGYSLKIKRSGTVLEGTARPYSDDGMTHSSFPFKFARVACK